MKQLYLTLIFLLQLLAGTVWAQSEERGPALTGLGVFGDGLGVHGTDTLAIWGDLVLEKAGVVGEGTLKLRGQRPAQLIAHHSKVPNLHIANASRVTLHGELRVAQRLTVEKGILDARPGTLTLPTACTIEISPVSRLLVQKNINIAASQSRSFPSGPQQSDANVATGLIWSTESRKGTAIWIVEKPQPFWTQRYRQEPTPPPEEKPSDTMPINNSKLSKRKAITYNELPT